jgi:hypothetical protein
MRLAKCWPRSAASRIQSRWSAGWGGQPILQQALEDEVSDFLGRAWHAGAQETGPACNGNEPRTAKTTGGPIEVERPRVRNAQALGMGR